jgi:hypothetical protein
LAFQEPFKTALKPIQIATGGYNAESFYLGHVIAIAKLVDCTKVSGRVSLKVVDEKMEYVVLENGVKITGNEFEFGDYTYGRYAWLLDNVQRIDPVPAKGKQWLWDWEQP